MPRLLLILLLAALFCGSASTVQAVGSRPQKSPEAIEAGAKAPDFTLKDLQGRQVSLSDFRGKVVFLNFWASWCPPCRAEMPSMERLREVYSDQEFVMLAVNAEQKVAAVKDFLQRQPHSFRVLLDPEGKAQQAYNVYRFPETFLIDREGRIVEHYLGARNWSSVEVLKRISSLLEE